MAANDTELPIDLPDETATAILAEDVAVLLARGDVVALSGGLGAGKTAFARALLRAVADDPSLDVPSPTFTLVQTYSTGRLPVAHFDLYRLSAAEELDEIGFEDAVSEGAVLIEWPERAQSRMPAERLALHFEIAGSGRTVVASGQGALLGRFRRSRAIRAFLERAGWAGATRRFLQGDASTRAYERIRKLQRKAVLMDWPPPRGAATGDPRAMYRARDVRPFMAVDIALREAGLSAPELYAADTDSGFLLMEDIGSEGIVAGERPIPERYRLAIAALAEIHRHSRAAELALPDGALHRLPDFSTEVLAAELELFPDWYIPHLTGKSPSAAEREEFSGTWAPLLARLEAAETSWTLLDVHSPNLLWLPDRQGVRRIGFLDFQDAMIGPAAYDVASLAEDARITVPPDLERDLVDYYLGLRRKADPGFDGNAFVEAYAILAAQRATRILGVFARLADRDGKTGYLRHIPRVREYLAQTLAHPVLSSLSVWYEKSRLLETDPRKTG
jgi:tRNA threonylcarbamoyl adenosine modification protein YjeE